MPAHTRHYTSTNIINQYILLFRQAYLYLLLQYVRYEIYWKNLIEIDMKAQRVYGPNKKVQTVAMRGLVQH